MWWRGKVPDDEKENAASFLHFACFVLGIHELIGIKIAQMEIDYKIETTNIIGIVLFVYF